MNHLIRLCNEYEYCHPPTLEALGRIKDDRAVRAIFDALRLYSINLEPADLTAIYTTGPDGEDTLDIRYFDIKEFQNSLFAALKATTDQDFGSDVAKWIAWRKAQKGMQ